MNSVLLKKILTSLIIFILISTYLTSGLKINKKDNSLEVKNLNPLDVYLKGYWKFDEGSGTTANDSSGNGNHGIITGGEEWVDGISGSALYFDGSNNCVEITDTSDFVFENESVSYSVWVQIKDNADQYRSIIILGDSSDSGYPNIALSKGRSGANSGRFYGQQYPTNPGGNFSFVYSIDDGNTLPKDQWLHLVSVIDYANTTQKLYLNGILQDTDTCIPFNMGAAGTLKLRIGKANWVGYNNYDPHYGLIDEVQIYNKALSESEIQELFDMYNLFGYWSFNNGTANDDSGHDRDGIIYGATYNSSGGPDNSGHLEFDGDDYINIPDTADLAFSNQDFSFSLWVQIYDNSNSYRYFMSLGDPSYSNNNWAAMFKLRSGASNGGLAVSLHDTPSSSKQVISNLTGSELPKYQWIHMVGVYDYNNDQLKMYYNGVLQSDVKSFGNYNLLCSPLVLNIGRFMSSYAYAYHVGKIDEVRIYSKALSQGEIYSLYNMSGGNQAPTVNITYPIMGQNVSGNITILGVASDPDGTVASVNVRIDLGPWENATGTTNWNFDWDSTKVNDGYHTIYARSFDGELYSSYSSVTVYIDNTVNDPPYKPEKPDGPILLGINETGVYTTSSIDPDDDPVRYGWDWNGDSFVDEWTDFYSSGEEIEISHFWGETGTYYIQVKAQDTFNTTSEWSDSLEVVVSNPQYPIAEFSWMPPNPETGQTITFDASDSYDPDGNIVLYEWDWDDDDVFDESHSTPTATNSWEQPGSYAVLLRVTDNDDLTENISKIVVVIEIQPPIADFFWTPENPLVNETINFDASDSYDPDGDIILYEWDWDNDGIYDESNSYPTTTYSWSSFGNYPVTLKVTDNNDFTDSITKIVNIIYILVPDNYPTIQEAVNNSEPGYYILVSEGTYEENIIIDIELLTLQAFGNKDEIIIDGTGKDDVIKVLDIAHGVSISGFTIKNSGQNYAGILLESGYNKIWNNKIVNNDDGLRFFKSNGNQIYSNTFSSDLTGIHIDDYSHGNNITDNTINGNTIYGINFEGLSTGNIVHNNIITNNGDSGIKINDMSKGNIITYNDIENNKIGINCSDSSDNNLFHHNSFINNNVFNAWDNSIDRWDDDTQGNYWDDYTGTDNNGDGIGDTPYPIPGGDNIDRYPLIHPPLYVTNPRFLEQETYSSFYKDKIDKIKNPKPAIFNTIVVPDDFPTIQEAVDHSNPGDRIEVRPDIYYENVVIDKSLDIIGDGSEVVFVDGGDEPGHIFSITADNVEIKGFTFQNCPLNSAGILVNNNFTNIYNNYFVNCGSGIELRGRYYQTHSNTIYLNDFSNNHYGIYLANCKNNLIENNNIKNNFYGIELGLSQIKIINNNIMENLENGILQLSCDNVTIKENDIVLNSISKNQDTAGIWIGDSYNCDYDDNIINYNHMDGITILRSSYNNFSFNNINNNEMYPLYFRFDTHNNTIINNEIQTDYECGMYLMLTKNSLIMKNNITNNNNEKCIILYSSSKNTFLENNFLLSNFRNENNIGFIALSGCNNNICYHNNFYGDCNAVDEGANIWDDNCFCGNYWGNYQGDDSDGDGIGDDHHDILGGNRDNYPLMYPWAPPGKPSKPSGQTNGNTGKEYSYSTSATDPNNLKVSYGWDWNGDLDVDKWTDYFNSSDTVSTTNIWNKAGTFNVRVIAKNEHGQVSDWSDPLEVTMPRNRVLISSLLCFFERFINLFHILKSILHIE